MTQPPLVLSIAGSDCSAGAGIQADLKTISALGGYGTTVITAVTAQNTQGVQAVHPLPPEVIARQLKAVLSDMQPAAIKIGMLADVPAIRVVAGCLRRYRPPHVVYDPVMVSTSGRRLLSEEGLAVMQAELLPHVTLLTPNLDEAEVLTTTPVHTLDEMKQAAARLSALYGLSVLVKGGHLSDEQLTDVLCHKGHTYIYSAARVETGNLHGTGCTLSSAIATHLASGEEVPEAVQKAKSYITQAIRAGKGLQIGSGNGPLWHFPEQKVLK